jgi:uracil-DNA glycosylase family 4
MSDDYTDVVVYGEGPLPAPVLLCGERPAIFEAKLRRPFVGPAGKELNRYLREVGLKREDIYLTNTVKVFRNYEKPSPEEILEWWPVLQQEINDCSPRVIGLLGTYAVETVMGAWWKSATLNVRHGTVWMLPESGVQVVPMYHPAYGIYDKLRQPDLQYDFRQLAAAVAGTAQPRMLGSHAVEENAHVWAQGDGGWGAEYDHSRSETEYEREVIHPW